MASVFTKIINGEIPSYKIAENEEFFAFLDINPLTKGHTLVIPKREVDNFFDLDDREIGDIMRFAKPIAERIKEYTRCRKVAVVVIGLEVAHAHIHLIPINTEDDVNFKRPKLKLSAEEFSEIAKNIRIG